MYTKKREEIAHPEHVSEKDRRRGKVVFQGNEKNGYFGTLINYERGITTAWEKSKKENQQKGRLIAGKQMDEGEKEKSASCVR